MKLSALFSILLLTTASATAHAAHPQPVSARGMSDGAAHSYAETALSQVRQARAGRCEFRGQRWSGNYQHHYQWALGKSRRALRRESDRRDDALNDCRVRHHRGQGYGYNSGHGRGNYHANGNGRGRYYQGRDYSRGYGRDSGRQQAPHHGQWSGIPRQYRHLMGYSREQFARWYADTAVEQAYYNRDHGCGHRGGRGRWLGDWNDHYRFGLKVQREIAIREVQTRKQALASCRAYH